MQQQQQQHSITAVTDENYGGKRKNKSSTVSLAVCIAWDFYTKPLQQTAHSLARSLVCSLSISLYTHIANCELRWSVRATV